MRRVHTLFSSTDDWDDQMRASKRVGLPSSRCCASIAHFAGQPAASFMVMAKVEAPDIEVWKRLLEGLGLVGPVAGEQRSTAARPEAIGGAIERVSQDSKKRYILMRLDRPDPGIALLGTDATGERQTHASVSLFVYGDNAAARAAKSEPLWRAWLNECFSGQVVG